MCLLCFSFWLDGVFGMMVMDSLMDMVLCSFRVVQVIVDEV